MIIALKRILVLPFLAEQKKLSNSIGVIYVEWFGFPVKNDGARKLKPRRNDMIYPCHHFGIV